MDDFDAHTEDDWRKSLAGRIDDLVRQFGASVFLQKWNTFKTDCDVVRKAKREWEQERQKYWLKVAENPAWRGADFEPPSPDWGWGTDLVFRPDVKKNVRVEAWMPPELIGTARPKVPTLLPLIHAGDPDYRKLTLDEKYAVLVLFHDIYGSHVELIIPEDAEDMDNLALRAAASDVPVTDRECLLRFLEEVKEDLSEQAKQAGGGDKVKEESTVQPRGSLLRREWEFEQRFRFKHPDTDLDSSLDPLISVWEEENPDDKRDAKQLKRSFRNARVKANADGWVFLETN